MKKKLCLLMALICCVAVFAVAFAACNDGGKGGGAGDVIFTEGASLEDILTALENAESLTYTYDYAVSFFNDPEESEVQAAYHQTGKYTHGITYYSLDNTTVYADGTTDGYFDEYYGFIEGDVVYMIDSYRSSGEEAEINGSKCMSEYSDFDEGYFAVIADDIEFLLTEKDGKVVFDEAGTEVGYVAGSGYVVLEGDVLRIGYKEQIGTMAQEYEISISGVNATTVTIPTEIAAEKANASWQDTVHYKGVDYEKKVDAEGKEYYYVRYKDNESAVPEKTINGLPVREI